MQGLYTILLLTVSNIFMTFAWYGHLKLAFIRCNLIFMGNCSRRIFISNTGKPYRI